MNTLTSIRFALLALTLTCTTCLAFAAEPPNTDAKAPANSIEIEPEVFWPADLNQDGMVNVNDLMIVIAAWGQSANDPLQPADLNHDGTVNGMDLIIVFQYWGA